MYVMKVKISLLKPALLKVHLMMIINLGYLAVKSALSKLYAVESTYCVTYLKCAVYIITVYNVCTCIC